MKRLRRILFSPRTFLVFTLMCVPVYIHHVWQVYTTYHDALLFLPWFLVIAFQFSFWNFLRIAHETSGSYNELIANFNEVLNEHEKLVNFVKATVGDYRTQRGFSNSVERKH